MLAFAHLKLNHRERGRQTARQLLELARTPEEADYAHRLLEQLERDPAPVGDVQSVSQDGSRAETGDREVRLIPNEAAVSPRGPESPRAPARGNEHSGRFVRTAGLPWRSGTDGFGSSW